MIERISEQTGWILIIYSGLVGSIITVGWISDGSILDRIS